MQAGVKRRAFGESSESDWIFLILLSLAGLLLTLAHRLDADEGQILNGAWNLFNGREIYEDFFEFIGPGSFGWVGSFFKIFGPSYWDALVASQILLLTSLWAFHDISLRVVHHRAAARSASILWLLAAASPPFINHNSYSSFLAVVFTLFMLRALVIPGGLDTLLAGAVSSLTFLFLQPKGLVLFILGALTLFGDLWRRPKGPTVWRSMDELPRSRFIRWSASPGGRVGLYLIGAVGVGGLGFLRWGPYPISTLLTVAPGTLAMNHFSLSYLPLLGSLSVMALVAWASHQEGLLDRAGVFLLFLQLGLWASSAHLPDAWHLWINSFPLLLMMGRLGGRALARASSPARRATLAVVFCVVAFGGAARLVVQNVSETRTTRTWIRELETVLDGEDFFVFTFLPSFYLEMGVPNPYFNSVLYTGTHPVEHFYRNAAILAREQPRFILLDYASVRKYGHTIDNPVDDFIRRHYFRAFSLRHSRGNLEVWERSQDSM